ncbi:MAG: hypothetical protein HOK41_03445 [Nitrospina sp.]|jgi:hypothetical protein|nr:hypothetical protein [Nitrospina sp.]MBT5469636.1 hypothetical protein [Nitrospina sp.]MBT6716682.1 hypothetical protein [Nitrospina sp.]
MASRHLDISCGKCGEFILSYRKEGSGQLIRLYLDKIQEPKSLASLKSKGKKSQIPSLVCPECNLQIGHPMEHERSRLAYRMIKGAFKKSGG